MSPPFRINVRLPAPLRDGGLEIVAIETPVRALGELLAVLESRLPDFSATNDELFNFAINGELIIHGERSVVLKSGDEVEIVIAFAGG
jgi:molybdopterin converting factor small subunit